VIIANFIWWSPNAFARWKVSVGWDTAGTFCEPT